MKKNISIKNINRIRIEKRDEFKDSLFSDQFDSMDEIVCNILERNENLEKLSDGAEKFANENYVHNIIAVVGERGMGKSSAMLSYAYFLKECSGEQCHNIPKKLEGKKFCVLDKMDANMVHGKEYLFDIVLAKMWDAFQEAYDNRLIKESRGKELQDSFRKVKNSYIYFKGVSEGRSEMKEYAPLQQLHDLSASMNLRGDFADLVKKYLECQSEKGPKQYLVICIDDMDLIANRAYERLEEIYSFFTIPQVLVFVSLDIQRMHMDLCKRFSQHLLWDSGDSEDGKDSGARVLKKRIEDYAEAYIAKVLPRNARVYMPHLGANLNNLIISDVGTELKHAFSINGKTGVSVNTFARMFFLHKMNIMFYDGENILFPGKRSLRNIVNRVYELTDMLQQKSDEGGVRLWMKKELSVSAEQLKDEVWRNQVYEIMTLDAEDYNYFYVNLNGGEYTTQINATYQKVIASLCKKKEAIRVERDYWRLLILLYAVTLEEHRQDPFEQFKEMYIKGNMIAGMIQKWYDLGWGEDKTFSSPADVQLEKDLPETLLQNAESLVKIFQGLLLNDIEKLDISVDEKDTNQRSGLVGSTDKLGNLEQPEEKTEEKPLGITVIGERVSISIDNYFYNVFEFESRWMTYIEKVCENLDLPPESVRDLAKKIALQGGLKLDQYRQWKETYQINTFCDFIPLQNVDIMLMLAENLRAIKIDGMTVYSLIVEKVIDVIIETFAKAERRQYLDSDAESTKSTKSTINLGKKYSYSEKLREIYRIAPYTSEKIQANPIVDRGPDAND